MSTQASSSGNEPDARDVLIAVMGPTGAGKSTFINIATQSDQKLPESGGEDSCTSTVDAAPPFEYHDRRVILYDTPGFDDSRMTDTEVLKIIIKELEMQYRAGIVLHGIIYLHPIDQPRVSGKARANFTLMQKICGNKSLENVIMVTNRWGRLTDAEKQTKWENLLSPGSFLAGAAEKKVKLAHDIDNTVESVRGIIDMIIMNNPMPLLAQTELVDENKTFGETSAGQEADKRLFEMEEKLKKEMAERLEEAKEAQRQRDLIMEEEMRKEAERYRQLIERTNNERLNLNQGYAAQISELKAQVAKLAISQPQPVIPPPPIISPPRIISPPSPVRPATLQSITSGKKHTIYSVKHGLYVTCSDDERSVTGRNNRGGLGRRWFFNQVSSGNWVIESTRYKARYLSTNDNEKVRARSEPEEWKIKTIPDSYGHFRLYNTAYQGDWVLSLSDDSVGTPIEIEPRQGHKDEIWKIEKIGS